MDSSPVSPSSIKSEEEGSFEDYSIPNSPMEVQYQEEISELKRKLEAAQRQIQKLQSKVGKQGDNTKSNRSSSKQSQSRYWTDEEHQLFLEALNIYGSKDVKAIANHVGTRNATQVRTHAQKYFLRLKREKQRSESKKKLVDTEQEQCDAFLSAVRATAFEENYERKAQLIHEQYMQDTPLETIKSWLFVHFKTVEKIQTSEAQHAAHSVGAKRLRSNSNPVSVYSVHRVHSSPLNPFASKPSPWGNNTNSYDTSSSFSVSSSPDSRHFAPEPLHTYQPDLHRSDSSIPMHEEPQQPETPLSYTAHHMDRISSLHRPRPMSEPLFDVYNSPLFNSHSDHNVPSPHMQRHIPMESHSYRHEQHMDIKPYVPGAPPPSSPAPPPPLFNDGTFSFL